VSDKNGDTPQVLWFTIVFFPLNIGYKLGAMQKMIDPILCLISKATQ
jgi:hypothetical protein